ncbi:hypothetical protein K439DRAFT_520294 [Ramaria rubella]|nr:hypothetical protein K439DRAFT_520294 [Ramaria rubella]
MKFTGSLSTLLVILPVLALQVSAAPGAPLAARAGKGQQFGGGRGGFGNNNNNNNAKGGNNNAAANGGNNNAAAKGGNSAAASSAVATAAAASGTAAAAAASSTAAAASNSTAAAAAASTSLTLDPSLIGSNLATNGLAAASSEPGQEASATSTNNFINFCESKTITNGLQNQAGSCNPVPMGNIPAKANQPAVKFAFPTNLANVGENASFTIQMNVQGMDFGTFVNPDTNYFAAPQDLNAQGEIIGHSHVVVQAMPSLTTTTPLDPTVFAFFQGLNAAPVNGQLTATVTKGLPAGTYRLCSINTAANHQPVVGPVAQHGSFDDCVYFTSGSAAGGAAKGGNAGAAKGAAAGGKANNNNNNQGGKGKGRRSFMISRQN